MRTLLLTLVLLTSSMAASHAAGTLDQTAADSLFHQLVEAQVTKNYDAFVNNATVELKAALSKTQFEASSDILIKRFKSGYTLDPLGELNQHGFQVYLYRFRFKDGTDDMMGTMTIKDSKVAGIFFK